MSMIARAWLVPWLVLAGCPAAPDGQEPIVVDDVGAVTRDATRKDASVTLDTSVEDAPVAPDAPVPDVPARMDAPPRPDVTAPDVTAPDVARTDVSVIDRPPDRPVAPVGMCTSLGPWLSSAVFASGDVVSHPLPSFAAGSFFYVHTMRPGGAQRRLLSARANADGSLGAWQTASEDHGGGPHGFTAVVAGGQAYHFRNGHIARYPLTADGRMSGDVVLSERSTQSSFGGNLYVWDSATVATPPGSNGWVFHLGGFSFNPYAYRQDVFRSAVPLDASFARMSVRHPAERPGRSAWVQPRGAARGFVVTSEGGGGARLWRAAVNATGAIEPWAPLPGLPAGPANPRGELLAVGDTLFAVRGARVFASRMDASGGLSVWAAMPSLPEEQINVTWGDGHQEGASWGVIQDTVYLTGPTRVFLARVMRDVPCL